MKLTLQTKKLPLKHIFTIARGSRSMAETVLTQLEHDGIIGHGEAAPIARYDESPTSIQAWYREHPLAAQSPFCFEELLAHSPPAARCALDIALHDWLGKHFAVPLWQWYQLDPNKTPVSSYTIGLDEPEVMLKKVEEFRHAPILKIKLGSPNDREIIRAIRARFTGILRIDANEGWTAQETVAILHDLQNADLELCEQPIPAGTPEQLRWIRERISIPLIADEDAHDIRDLASLRDAVDGVNVKLVKTGGIRGALAMIQGARATGLRVMLGCMLESSLLSTAAAHLSPLADWADLDAPLLINSDPFIGLTYRDGKLVLPHTPGIGVRVNPAFEEAP